MTELSRAEQNALANKLANLQASVNIIDEITRHQGGSTVLETEKHALLVQIDKLQTAYGQHFQAKDAKQPRAQL